MGLFGPSIDYELQDLPDREIHGAPAPAPADHASLRELKRRVRENFGNFACPSCGNRRIRGSRIVVTYEKVRCYRQEAYQGWFGATKHRDILFATVWRVCEVWLKPGRESGWIVPGIEPGKLECAVRGCGWKEEAPSLPAQSLSDALGIEWYSVNDILHGKPWKG